MIIETLVLFGLTILIWGCARTVYAVAFTPALTRPSHPSSAAVDMLVPARNEVQRGLSKHVRLLLGQKYANFRVILTDDQSTDETAEVLEKIRADYDRQLIVVAGQKKPLGWIGKTFALHQAKGHSDAPWIALVDADVHCEPELVAAAVSYAEDERLDALCVLPQFQFQTFLVGIVLPVFVWLSVMRVSPTEANRASSGKAFGFGNFILLRREAHDAIGGFEAYRHCVLDDYELIIRLKRSGHNIRLVYGPTLLKSAMYHSFSELWQGFLKNAFAALGYSWFRIIALVFTFVATGISYFLASTSGEPWLGAYYVGIGYATAAIFGARIRAPVQYYVLFPMGLAISMVIILHSALRTISGNTAWKGRIVTHMPNAC